MGDPSTSEVKIPTYRDLMLPTLQALDALGGLATVESLEAKTVEIFNLTPEQLAVAFNAEQSTTGSKVIHRLGWARTYLRKVELIENTGRGEWALLDEGRRVLGLPATEAVDLLVSLDKEIRKSSSDGHHIRRGADPAFARVYETADRWRDVSLAAGSSLFDPSKRFGPPRRQPSLIVDLSITPTRALARSPRSSKDRCAAQAKHLCF